MLSTRPLSCYHTQGVELEVLKSHLRAVAEAQRRADAAKRRQRRRHQARAKRRSRSRSRSRSRTGVGHVNRIRSLSQDSQTLGRSDTIDAAVGLVDDPLEEARLATIPRTMTIAGAMGGVHADVLPPSGANGLRRGETFAHVQGGSAAIGKTYTLSNLHGVRGGALALGRFRHVTDVHRVVSRFIPRARRRKAHCEVVAWRSSRPKTSWKSTARPCLR